MNNPPETTNMQLVMDVKVELTVRIGSSRLAMRDIIALNPGTVLQLDQKATEPVGLYVHEKLIARGEVVVIDENFGIKITQLTGEAS